MNFNPKFVSNTINPMAKTKTLADMVNEYVAKNNKQASNKDVVKTASATEEIVKVALTPAQEKLPEALKNAIKAKEEKSGKKDEKPEDKKEKEVKDEKKDDKKEEKEAKTEVLVKIAEEDEAPSSGQLKVEPLHQKGESTPTPHKEKEKSTGTSAKKSDTEKDEAETSGQPEVEAENHNDPEAGKHRDGDGDEKKKASQTPRFIKVANLDAKTKTWLKAYWKNLYPAAYVDAMLADK